MIHTAKNTIRYRLTLLCLGAFFQLGLPSRRQRQQSRNTSLIIPILRVFLRRDSFGQWHGHKHEQRDVREHAEARPRDPHPGRRHGEEVQRPPEGNLRHVRGVAAILERSLHAEAGGRALGLALVEVALVRVRHRLRRNRGDTEQRRRHVQRLQRRAARQPRDVERRGDEGEQ